MKSVLSFVLQFLLVFSISYSAFGFNTTYTIEENATFLKIKVHPKFTSVDTLFVENNKYLLPQFDEPVSLENINNQPFLIFTKLIAVPDSNAFQLITASSNDFYELEGKLPDEGILNTAYNFTNQRSSFENIHIGNNWAFIQYHGIARNLPIAHLNIIFAKNSDEKNRILIPKEITIEISFLPVIRNLFKTEIFLDVINTKQAQNWAIDFVPVNQVKEKFDKSLSTNNTFVKIKVDKEGIYKIDASMLASIGIYISPQLINTIKLYGNNGKPLQEPPNDPPTKFFNQIPIIVRTKPDGELDYILFYAIGSKGFEYVKGKFRNYQNPYSNSNYYLLGWDGEEGLRLQPAEEPNDCAQPIIPQFYNERILYREEIANPFNSGSGKIWFGASIFPRFFTNLLPDLYRNGTILYRFYVAQNYSDQVNNLYGQFTFYEGQNKLGEVYIPRCVTYEEAKAREFEATLPANQIPSDSRSYLRIEYQSPIGSSSSATPFFNWYEIHFPRQFKAIDKSLGFFTEPNSIGCYEYQITGFEGETIGLDVSDPTSPKQLINRSVVLNTFTFRTSLDSSNVKRFFLSSNFLKPEIEKIELKMLTANPLNAEVIVITHKSLLNSANLYKDFREKTTKYKVAVINVEDIYNEYAYGLPDPMAIRYFLADAIRNWKTKPIYVVLWGDGHFDFRGISTKRTNYIPAFQAADDYNSFFSTISYTSDDFYAFLVGNDWAIDVAIARVPIYDDQTGLIYLEKLNNYEFQSDKTKWRCTALFCADDSPQSRNSYDGNLHTNDSETIANSFVPKDIFIKKIYLPEYPTENIPGGRRKPLATADLVKVINDGTLLVNWLGHGNPRVWAHEELFDRDQTISLLSNKNKLFIGIAATCDFGRFDMTEIKSGTEELLFYRKGGAIAYISATRAVYTTDNKIFNQNIVGQIFTPSLNGRYKTLGEAYFNVKQVSIGDNHRKYILFGDPLITPILPENWVTLTKINNIDLKKVPKDSVLYIKAYSVLKIQGEIHDPKDSTLLSNFNGTVEVVINDVGYTKTVIDIDNTQHHIYKDGGIIFKGVLKVENGKFDGDFYLTDEVSFLNGNITIRFFAKDTINNFFAKGIERRLRISGVDTTTTFVDVEPPIVSIFIDDTTFISGDLVSNPPTLIVRLYDNTAISTTGVGIGHSIEAWIDDNPESIDLTNDYESVPENPRLGFIRKLLPPLQPGTHRIKVRAWDIFNNFSTNSVEFQISDPDAGIILTNPLVKPQPASNSITFYVQHNINVPYDVRLEIFNNIGQKIFESTFDFNRLRSFEIPYDCTDNSGNQIPSGVYFYKLFVATSSKNAHIIGKFAIVR
ncbi:MAG: type IX secretion system sortase PorU [Candidatus Kapaibacteriota bacterium]